MVQHDPLRGVKGVVGWLPDSCKFRKVGRSQTVDVFKGEKKYFVLNPGPQ